MSLSNNRGRSMRTHPAGHGKVVALCKYDRVRRSSAGGGKGQGPGMDGPPRAHEMPRVQRTRADRARPCTPVQLAMIKAARRANGVNRLGPVSFWNAIKISRYQ